MHFVAENLTPRAKECNAGHPLVETHPMFSWRGTGTFFVASQGSELLRRNKSTLSTCAGAGSQLLTQQQSEKMSGVEWRIFSIVSPVLWMNEEPLRKQLESSLSSTFHCKPSTHCLAGKIPWWKQKVLSVGLIFLSLKVAGCFQGKLFNGFLFPKSTLCK